MKNNHIHPRLPMAVNAYADLAPQTNGDQSGADSWFLVAHTKTNSGQEYAFLIHCLNRGTSDNKVTVCISDISGKDYISQITYGCDIAGTEKGVSFACDVLHWNIEEQSMKVSANVQSGKYGIELTIKGDNTVFGYNSNALIPLFGKEIQNIQYSFPKLTVMGRLTVEGEQLELTGEGWFDRQWGPQPFPEMLRGDANWLWIAGNLDNGYSIAIWSTILHETSYDWITALSPDGVYLVAPIASSVLSSSSDPWVSENSGKQWFSRWKAAIPALDTDLEISMTHPGQEIFSATDKLPFPNIEASVKISGLFQGKPANGKGFVEIVR